LTWFNPYSRASPRIRGIIKVNSGAAGIGIGLTELLWVWERIKETANVERGEEDLGSLLWGWGARRRLREAKTFDAVIFSDTDPASEARFKRASQIAGHLRIPATWVKVPGPTAGQDPAALDERLKKDTEAVKPIIEALRWASNVVDLKYVQSIQFNNSMHGSGMAINSYIAEEVAPNVLKGDYYRQMLVTNADITRAPSPLDYLKSTKWSLNKLDELLAKDVLDAVMVVDNTVASAVKSVWKGMASKEELKKAWLKFMKTEDLYEATAIFYEIMAKIARLDPHETNDLIVHASAPLTIVPAWGMLIEKAEREIRASSAPWDYYNIKRVTKKGYIIPGYLPSEQLQKIDFKTIASELAITTLAPLDPTAVTNIIVVLGEDDKRIWEGQGISMYAALEKSFMQVGYDGPLDVLTLPREGGVWIYAVVDNVRILEAKFEQKRWR